MKKEFEEFKTRKQPFRYLDFIVLGVVVILAVAFLCVTFIETDSPSVCKIYQDGKCVRTINLKDVGGENGFGETTALSRVYEYNNVRIAVYKDGVAVVNSDCYDNACVTSGKITKKGESIECTPLRIVVTLE